MVKGMSIGKGSHAQAGDLRSIAEWAWDLVEFIFIGNRSQSFMEICKGTIQKLHDFSFGFERIGATLATDIHGWLFLQDAGAEDVVDRGDVLHLLGEGANAFELTGCRSEGVLVFRHGVGGAGEFAGADVEDCIEGIARGFYSGHRHLAEGEPRTAEHNENS